MKSIFQVRRPLTGCEHIWWTESGGNQIMGAVQWDIDNKCQRQSNEQRGMKDRRTSQGKMAMILNYQHMLYMVF